MITNEVNNNVNVKYNSSESSSSKSIEKWAKSKNFYQMYKKT